MATIQDQITATATSYGVDPALALAVAKQESGFNQNAVSPKGALGVFQLLPSTAMGLGVDPNSLSGNIEGGVKYLSQLLTKYNGDESLALAAYNAGPGNVAKYGGIPPFAETQNYVASIMNSIGSYFSPTSTDTSGGEVFYDASISPLDWLSSIDFTNPFVIGGIGLVLGLVIWKLRD